MKTFLEQFAWAEESGSAVEHGAGAGAPEGASAGCALALKLCQGYLQLQQGNMTVPHHITFLLFQMRDKV